DFVQTVAIAFDSLREPFVDGDHEVDLVLDREGLEADRELVQEAAQVDGLHVEPADARLEPADVEQLLDQPTEPIRLVPDRVENLLLLAVDRPIDLVPEERYVST